MLAAIRSRIIGRFAMFAGSVILFVMTTVSSGLPQTCCQGASVGDVDCSGSIDISDISIMIDNLFLTMTPLCCKDEANFNYPGGWYSPTDTIVDITDLQIMIDGQFISMATYPPCPSDMGEPTGSMLARSTCNMWKSADETTGFYPNDQSCIEWHYDAAGQLNFFHYNAAFNCCPTLDVTVDVEAGVITLHEVQVLGECACLCLYDLTFQVNNLPPGIYRMVADEAYGSGMGALDFTINLVETPDGYHCVERTEYPWGTY